MNYAQQGEVVATGKAPGEKTGLTVFFNWLVGLEDYPGSLKLLRLAGGALVSCVLSMLGGWLALPRRGG